eukprot:2608397-Rhodomonas_salina.2
MFGQESDTFSAEQIQNMVTFAIVFVGLTTVGQSFLNKIDPVRQKEKEEAAAREKAAAKKAERDGVQAVIDTKKVGCSVFSLLSMLSCWVWYSKCTALKFEVPLVSASIFCL